MKRKLKWENIYYATGVLKYEGFTYFDLKLKELVPSGQGLKYFEKDKSFKDGIEFNIDGSIKQKYKDVAVEIIASGPLRDPLR